MSRDPSQFESSVKRPDDFDDYWRENGSQHSRSTAESEIGTATDAFDA